MEEEETLKSIFQLHHRRHGKMNWKEMRKTKEQNQIDRVWVDGRLYLVRSSIQKMGGRGKPQS